MTEACYVFPDTEEGRKYQELEDHTVVDEVRLARRIAGRQLGKRLKLYKKVNTLHKTKTDEYDADLTSKFMAGLEHSKKLSDIKIMGALLNPLYQNGERMVDAGLCTQEQLEAGRVELLDRIGRFYERTASPESDSESSTEKTNKYDSMTGPRDGKKTPLQRAENEYKKYVQWNKFKHLPEMERFRVLGAHDTNTGDPIEPILHVGRVIKKGKDLKSGKNHASYVDKFGHYSLEKYLSDHAKTFPGIHNVGVGEICPHVSTEVDCESLFSQAGFYADPRRSRSGIRMYERLVMMAHRLNRIYIHPALVRDEFMKRFKANDWDENEERDSREFLELEKEIHLNMFPHSKAFDDDDDDDEQGENGDSEEEGGSEGSKSGREVVEIGDNSDDDESSESDEAFV